MTRGLTGRARPAARQPGPERRLAALACVGGVLLGTLYQAPARWLAPAVLRASQGRVELINTQGTLWQGRSDLLLAGGAGSSDALALPAGLSWTLRPAWQDGPALQMAVRLPCCTTQDMVWHVGWRWQGGWAQLSPSDSVWPAAWLAGLGAPWNTVQLQGTLQLHTDGVTVHWAEGRGRFQGGATLQALNLSSSLSTLKPLGDYRIDWTPDANGGMQVALKTLRGELSLEGQGQWSGGHWRFQGLAEASERSESALSNLLNILGRREGPRAHLSLG